MRTSRWWWRGEDLTVAELCPDGVMALATGELRPGGATALTAGELRPGGATALDAGELPELAGGAAGAAAREAPERRSRGAGAAARRLTAVARAERVGAVGHAEAGESEAVSQLLAHVKLLLRRRAAAMAALDAGLPAEAVRHFTKILEARRGVLPHPFAAACLVGRATTFQAGGRPADAIADCNHALALDLAYIPALRARADLLQSVGALADCLRDLDHLKLLYDAALRDGKLPGPRWRSQGGVNGEIASAHRKLTARIQALHGRVAAGEACNVDYYLLLGLRRGCTRSELERAHLLLSLKLKPDRAVVFGERLELVDEHRDLEAVRDQARMSVLLLCRMLQKRRGGSWRWRGQSAWELRAARRLGMTGG